MNNLRRKILVYDLIILVTFLPLVFVHFKMSEGYLCGTCFANSYMPIISLVLGIFCIVGLCFLNHVKNKKEPALKWSAFIFYIGIAIVVFEIANTGIAVLGEVLNFGPHNFY